MMANAEAGVVESQQSPEVKFRHVLLRHVLLMLVEFIDDHMTCFRFLVAARDDMVRENLEHPSVAILCGEPDGSAPLFVANGDVSVVGDQSERHF